MNIFNKTLIISLLSFTSLSFATEQNKEININEKSEFLYVVALKKDNKIVEYVNCMAEDKNPCSFTLNNNNTNLNNNEINPDLIKLTITPDFSNNKFTINTSLTFFIVDESNYKNYNLIEHFKSETKTFTRKYLEQDRGVIKPEFSFENQDGKFEIFISSTKTKGL